MKRIFSWLGTENNFLGAALGFSLLLRLAFIIKTGEGGLSPDSHDWMNAAWRIASGEGFGDSWRPPGYAFYLGGVFAVFGKSILAAKLMNALLGTATVLLAYLTAARLFNTRAARITAVLMSFYPYFIAYAGDLLSETFLTFMIAASVYATARTADKPSWGNIAATGVLMGLTGLTKSVVLPFFVLACAWLWWRTRSFKTGFMTGAFVLLAIAPWSLRNYLFHGGGYVMPVNTPWYSFYGSTNDGALYMALLPELDRPPTDDFIAPAIPDDWAYVSALPLPERDKYCKEKALAWIRENPGKFLQLMRLRFVHFWHPYPVMAWPWQKQTAMLTSGIYIPLCVLGLIVAWRRFRETSLLLALFVSYTAVHLFFVVTLRYRVPIDTFVIMAAALALDAVWKRLKNERA